jgi:hypothetical protein
MSYQARYIGLDEVLDAFRKKAKTPYFSLWLKGQPLCQYRDGDTIDDAIEKITEEIELGIKRQITHEHELFLHTKKEKDYTRKSDSYCVIGFRCFDLPGNAVGAMDHNVYTIAAMHQEMNRLKSEVSALQAEKIESEDDEDNEDQNTFMSGFNQMVEHPLVVGLINKWLTGTQPVNNLAGINHDQTLQETINILFSKGVELHHLQKLAEMPADKIQMLLTML